MAAELKIGIGADISSLTKAVSDAKEKIGDLGNIKLPTIKVPKVEIPPIKIPEIKTEEFQKTIDSLNNELLKVGGITEVFGKSVDNSKRELSAYKKAFEDLIGQGLRPTHPEVLKLASEIDRLDKEIEDASRKIPSFSDKIKRIGEAGDVISNIGQKMTVGLTLPIMALGAGALKAYGDIQSLQKGLEAVMGSAGAASKEFEQLKQVARLPGLGMEEAVRGSINLQAIGLSADRSREILQQFGNAVASVGKGKAEFERAIYGVQQLANTDFPLGEDLNIIKDALPQVSNLLKEAFGTSRSDELAKMGVSSKQVLDVITAGLEKLPRVTGGINGAFENLGDSMKTSLARIGKIIDDTFDISGVIDKLTGYLDTAITYFENLSPAIQKTILVVTGLVAAVGPLLVGVGSLLAMLPQGITLLGVFKLGFAALTGPIALVTAGIVGIVAVVVSNWDKINPYFRGTVEWFRRLYNESAAVRIAVNAIGGTFKTSFAVVGDVLSGVWRSIKAFGKGILELFAGVGSVIEGALTLDFSKIKAGYSRGFAAINGTASSFVTIFKDTVKNIGGSIFNPTFSLPNIDPSLPDKVQEFVSKGIEKGLKKVKKKKINVELPDVTPIAQSTKGFLDILGNEVKNFWEIDDPLSKVSDSFERLPNTIILAGKRTSEAIESFKKSLSGMADYGSFLSNSLNLAFDSVVSTITDSFSAMGEAMATGGNVLQSLGKAVLAGVGNFLGALGKQMVQYGVAALAMSVLSKLLTNPITAAPAAVGMIAAGAALSAISGAINGTLKNGASGGNYSSGGNFSGSAGGGVANYTSSYSTGTGSNNEFRFVIMGDDLYSVMERAKAKHERLS